MRRYGRQHPGELVHVDVEKLGRIPDGGGHRALGRAAARPNRNSGNTGNGTACLCTALDDCSHLAYSEILDDEKAATCAAFLRRAAAWFREHGIGPERVPTDNAWAYSKNTWRRVCAEPGIWPRWTRPRRPQTNGRVERFHQTLLQEWAYARPYTSDAQRQAAYPAFSDWYNCHRPHTGIGGRAPAERVPDLPEHHIQGVVVTGAAVRTASRGRSAAFGGAFREESRRSAVGGIR